MPEGTEPQAAQTIDIEAMTSRIAAEAQRAAAVGTQQAIERVAANNRQEAERRAAAERTQADPVASTILGTVEPALRNIAVRADSGRDAAVFYATRPEAAKYSGQIEARFNELLARGIPVDRASIFNLLMGENLDTVVAERIAQRDEEVKRAEEAATIRGSRGGAPNQVVRDASRMKPDELEQALEGLAF